MGPDHDHPHPHAHPHPSEDAHRPAPLAGRPFRLGVAGPVGSGKTTLVAALCALLGGRHGLAVVTNDIYTTEDAEALRRAGVIDPARVVAVRTGCCPHTAIRDDISANVDALLELEERLGDVTLSLVESGGDNLTATFSRGLVDRQIFVIDTAGGDDIPRKGGPGITASDLLVINKVDLAPYVGADIDRMVSDAVSRRQGRPVLCTKIGPGTPAEHALAVAAWVEAELGAAVASKPLAR